MIRIPLRRRRELVVVDATGRRRLGGTGGVLPAIRVTTRATASPDVLAGVVRRRLGLDVVILRVPDDGPLVVELADPAAPLPSGLRWTHLAPEADTPDGAPWERPGWRARIMAEVAGHLRTVGISVVDIPRQHRHTNISEILRLPTGGPDVWLKAVPAIFAEEGARVAVLAGLDPLCVPAVVVRGDGWWVSETFPAARGRPRHDPLVALARLQIASIPRIGELLPHGFRVHPLADVAAGLVTTVRRVDLLGRAEARALSARLGRFSEICRAVDRQEFPTTVLHGDFHRRNLRWARDRWFIFDWTDACLGHPFLDLALPLWEDRPGRRRGRAVRYAQAWAGVVPHGATAVALRHCLAIGAAHQLNSYRRIVEGIDARGGLRLQRLTRVWARRLLESMDAD